MVFYARPLDQKQADLEKHLSMTADLAKSLVGDLGVEETAYLAGLLHDLGKLNPYYQTLFATSEQEKAYRAKAPTRICPRALGFFSFSCISFIAKNALS